MPQKKSENLVSFVQILRARRSLADFCPGAGEMRPAETPEEKDLYGVPTEQMRTDGCCAKNRKPNMGKAQRESPM